MSDYRTLGDIVESNIVESNIVGRRFTIVH